MALIRINRHPSRRQLAVFGLAWLVFLGTGSWLQGMKSHQSAALVLAGLAAGVPLIGLFSARGLRFFYLGLSYATYPIGFAVSHVVLAGLYFLVLTPIGLVLKLCGHDPLGRRPAPTATSYWQPRVVEKSPASYLRQH